MGYRRWLSSRAREQDPLRDRAPRGCSVVHVCSSLLACVHACAERRRAITEHVPNTSTATRRVATWRFVLLGDADVNHEGADMCVRMHSLTRSRRVGAMDFAERQLRKYGWKRCAEVAVDDDDDGRHSLGCSGHGLGKTQTGRAEPLKVNMKRDLTGVRMALAGTTERMWWWWWCVCSWARAGWARLQGVRVVVQRLQERCRQH
jgi:hypothetical protein